MLDKKTYLELLRSIKIRLLKYEEENSNVFSHALSLDLEKELYNKISKRIISLPKTNLGEYITSKVDEKSLKDSVVYNKALISRQYWNYIIHNKKKPSKVILARIAVALELTSKEFQDMLTIAGYGESKLEKIVDECLKVKVYDFEDVDDLTKKFDAGSILKDIV